MMGSLHRDQELSDCLGGELAGLAFGEGKHGTLHEVELLLEVVEANACVDLVPVQHLRLVGYLRVGSVIDTLQAAIDILVVENVEQLLEKESVTEVHRQILDFPSTSHREDLVQQDSQIVRLLQNGTSPVLVLGWVLEANLTDVGKAFLAFDLVDHFRRVIIINIFAFFFVDLVILFFLKFLTVRLLIVVSVAIHFSYLLW